MKTYTLTSKAIAVTAISPIRAKLIRIVERAQTVVTFATVFLAVAFILLTVVNPQ